MRRVARPAFRQCSFFRVKHPVSVCGGSKTRIRRRKLFCAGKMILLGDCRSLAAALVLRHLCLPETYKRSPELLALIVLRGRSRRCAYAKTRVCVCCCSAGLPLGVRCSSSGLLFETYRQEFLTCLFLSRLLSEQINML